LTKWTTGTLGEQWTGFVMAAFGGLDVLGSFGLGKLIDKYGRKPVIIFGTISTLAALAIFLLIPIDTFKTQSTP